MDTVCMLLNHKHRKEMYYIRSETETLEQLICYNYLSKTHKIELQKNTLQKNFPMDTFNNYCGSSTVSSNYTTTSSKSDEEVILASNRPKKRAGRTKFKETRHPVYRGVRKRNNDKWVCEVREPNKKTRIWLGTFPTPEMAARAHDVAAIALRGRSACLNFADSVWRLPTPASLDAKDIRKAAAEAAKAYEQQHSESNDGTFEKNDVKMEILTDEKEEQFYMDEDEEFGMPRLLADMAEGLLLSPPAPSPSNGFEWDDTENNYDEISLWSYSL